MTIDVGTLVSGVCAVALLVVGLMLRRFERRLDHIEELRIAESAQKVRTEAITERVKAVELEAHKWDVAVETLSDVAAKLTSLLEWMVKREEARERSGP